MIRDLLHQLAIVVVTLYMAGLAGSVLVGAVASLIDGRKAVRERVDQDLVDAAVIRASRSEVTDVR